jgi:transcriptional regulator with PAS, ATPase and Fis domain
MADEPTLTAVPQSDRRMAPGSALYVLLECDRPLVHSSRHALAEVDEVVIGRGDTREAVRRDRRLVIRVPDRWASRRHARLRRELARWIVEDLGSKNGSLLNGRPLARSLLEDGDVLEVGHTVHLYRSAAAPVDEPPDTLPVPLLPELPDLETFSLPLAALFRALPQVARSSVSVLVGGPTGAGKELVARALHQLSRRPGPFLGVNCAAIPEALVASELFGHRKGAFSGAHEDRQGLMVTAGGGTLFLDEIGDLPAAAQITLLRALQEREVLPVGGRQAVPIDIRVVSATHRDMPSLVAGGLFREDLYGRLCGLTLQLPRLCDRREDLGLLISRLLPRVAPGRDLTLEPAVVRAFLSYDWPRNVRELEAVLAGGSSLAPGSVLALDQLPAALRQARRASPPAKTPDLLSDEERRMREELLALLQAHGGNLSAVARVTGKARMQIHRWLKRYRINPADYRRP